MTVVYKSSFSSELSTRCM